MIARSIRPEEKLEARKLQSIAFLLDTDFSDMELNPEKSSQGFETTRAIFNSEGKMCACMELLPFRASFDGHSVALGGIGGVATLPEERRNGYMRSIFILCMEEMYEKGYVFSYLFPFSHTYYRKYGYELNMCNRQLKIPLSSILSFEQQGIVKQYTKGMNTEPVQAAYDKYISDKNLAIIRDRELWENFFSKDPFKDNVYIYIWHDKGGIIRGYIKFKVVKRPNYGHDMQIIELIWLDNIALAGILAFVCDHISQFENAYWNCPEYLDILSYFPEPYDLEQKIVTNGMNRIINVEKALKLISPPGGSGDVVIEVVDDFFDKNTGRYSVSWEYGTLEATTTRKEPDTVLDIRQLAQLVTGYRTITALDEAGKIELRSKTELLSRLFAPKRLFINDKF